jgi:hypothetical protein
MTKIGFEKNRIDQFFRGEFSETDFSYIDEIFADANYDEDLRTLLRSQFFELLSKNDLEDKKLDHLLPKICKNNKHEKP